MTKVHDGYGEIFEVEIECWCYGITNYPGEIYPALVHRIIKELSNSFQLCIKTGYAFSVLGTSLKIARAAKYLVHEKEIAFAVLAQLPSPFNLSEEEQYTLAKIIDEVEQKYGGALERLQKKWAYDRRNQAA